MMICREVGCDLQYCQHLAYKPKHPGQRVSDCKNQFDEFRNCVVREKKIFRSIVGDIDTKANPNAIPDYLDKHFKEKEKAKKLGLVWKRVGYGKEGEKGITHKVKDGKLEPVGDDTDNKEKDSKDDKEVNTQKVTPQEFDAAEKSVVSNKDNDIPDEDGEEEEADG